MPTPRLGYGKPSEASIDQVNRWMRSQPWWAQIRGAQTGDLSQAQREQIRRAAQANGVVLDEGDMEIDRGGNINPKGHKLRNTLIVAGIAGATIATMGAAGAFSAATLPAATGVGGLSATSLGLPVTAGLGTAGAAAAGAGGAATAASIAGGTRAGMAGLSYADILKYGVPEAGAFVRGLIQRKDDKAASSLEQRYLEEALAYQKEQDAYERTRRERLDAQEASRYDATWNRDESRYGDEWDRSETRYGDTQREYLSEFARNEDRYGFEADREASRYADTSKRIAPYLQSGANANDRMAQLLGLPAGAPFDPTLTPAPTRVRSAPPVLSTGSKRSSGPAYAAVDLAPDVSAFISQWQATHPVSEGVGPLYDALAAKGFKVGRPTHAGGILSDDKLTINGHMYDFARNWNPQGAGSAWTMDYVEPDARTYAAAAPRPTTTPAPVITTQPQARSGALVTVRAPTGQTQQVPADQVQHYLDRGATVIQGAA